MPGIVVPLAERNLEKGRGRPEAKAKLFAHVAPGSTLSPDRLAIFANWKEAAMTNTTGGTVTPGILRAVALCLLAALGVFAPTGAAQGSITTFDAPGAGTAAGQGTFAAAISPTGAIAGPYTDASNVNHGFVRTPDGIITTFDAPGAGTGANQGTIAVSINLGGAIAGLYIDTNSVQHGFLRSPDGTFITFDAPGAGTGSGQGTLAGNINDGGFIAGYIIDGGNVFHGFVRTPAGTFTTFDAPGAGTGPNQGTRTFSVDALTREGAIGGNYFDASNVSHGYLRAPGGTITTFDAPGAGTAAGEGTFLGNINSAGVDAGFLIDTNRVRHGIVRAPDGTFTTFDVPGAGSGLHQGTAVENINAASATTGEFVDTNNVAHCFVRAPDGTITTFDVTGSGTSPGQGTFAGSNNLAGEITGWFIDASGVGHGFATAAPGLSFSLSGDWTNTTNPNGPWSYNQGNTPLPLVADWTAADSAFVGCNQPAWAPSNVGGNFLPALMNANACTANDLGIDPVNGLANVAPGDIVTHTVDPFNGNPGNGVANFLFTLPAGDDGQYEIRGFVWDAGLFFGTSRPQDWKLLINGVQMAASVLSGVVSHSEAQAFDFLADLTAGDTVELQLFEDPTAGAGFFVGTNMSINRVALPAAKGFAYVANCTSTCGSLVDFGNVSAYSIDGTSGALSQIPGSPFPAGISPFWVTLDPTGRFAYVANLGGNISAYSVNATTGALSPVPGSPFFSGGTPSSVTVDPTGRFAYVANRNPSDISGFTIDGSTGALTPISGSPFPAIAGSNDFTVTVDTTGKFAYVANLLTNNISAYSIDGTTGALTPVPGSPFPAGTSPFVIAADPAGPFLYSANAGSNNVSAFGIDGSTGALTPVPGSPFPAGTGPRSVTVDPKGHFVYTANQGGDVSGYTINAATGALTAVPGSPFAAGAQPVSVTVDRSGRFAYVANASSNNVSSYSIDGTTGALTPVPGSPFAAGTFPVSVVALAASAATTVTTPPQPVAPGTSTTFTNANIINQTVVLPPDANMNGTVTMAVSFIQVAPAVFNASIAGGTNGNAFSGGKPVPAGTTCTPIAGAGGNCVITEDKCFDANGTAFALCPITAPTTPIQLTSSYKTLAPQTNPALLIASDGQSNYAVITTGFNPADPTISGGTKALNSDAVIGNLPGTLSTDTVAPTTTATTSPVAPNGANGWFTTSPVSVILTATDDTLVKQISYSATGAQPIALTTVAGASTLFQIANEGVTTISFQATDQAGNVEALKTLIIKIDTTAPSISISAPPNGATYTLNQAVAASYSCSDPESSPAPSCTGPVPNGSNIDTASVGSKVFTVNSTDAAGLGSTQTDSYTVSYNVCILYNPALAVNSGAVIPLKMYLCDAKGNDVSNSSVIVHAKKLIQVSTQASDTIVTAGSANPGNDFRFDSTLGPSGGYIFNLLANLPTGTYELFFTAGNDPSTTHFLTFQVK
jgi:6-phosphogluconolactonase (cycloisomerase 2 family)